MTMLVSKAVPRFAQGPAPNKTAAAKPQTVKTVIPGVVIKTNAQVPAKQVSRMQKLLAKLPKPIQALYAKQKPVIDLTRAVDAEPAKSPKGRSKVLATA